MTDIVELLQEVAAEGRHLCNNPSCVDRTCIAQRAADEIERLRGLLRECIPSLQRDGRPHVVTMVQAALGDIVATDQPKEARHSGYIIGNHWLQTAYDRICAGEDEATVLDDYGVMKLPDLPPDTADIWCNHGIQTHVRRHCQACEDESNAPQPAAGEPLESACFHDFDNGGTCKKCGWPFERATDKG